ncbi:uncharacterized protein DS421_17g583770 [Arachis hypogaea]|nr:uncharacterized protein DS421_17g583770 [Arachis hypogaea]
MPSHSGPLPTSFPSQALPSKYLAGVGNMVFSKDLTVPVVVKQACTPYTPGLVNAIVVPEKLKGEGGAAQPPSMEVFVWLEHITRGPMLTVAIPGYCRRSCRLSFGKKSFGNVRDRPHPVQVPGARSSSRCSSSCARKRSCLKNSRGFVGGDDDKVASCGSSRSSRAPKNQDGETIAMSMVTNVSGMQTEVRKLSAMLSRHDALVQEVRDAIKLLRRDNSAVSLNLVPFGHCATCTCCKGEATAMSKKRTIDSQLRTPGQGKGFSSRPTMDTTFTSPASPSPEVVDLTSEKVCDSPSRRNPPKEGSGCMRRPTRVQTNYYPAENDDVLDVCQQTAMKVNHIPRTMNLAFQPQHDMNLSPVELAVAAYVFRRDLPPSELLVDVGDGIANRAALMTLVPRAEVVDDVGEVSLLELYQQAALKGRTLTSGIATSLRNNYMRCKVDRVTRVDHRCQWLPSILPVKRFPMRCHRTANHLQVLNHAGIGSAILLRLSLRPALVSLKLVTAIRSLNPTRNTTDKV